MATHARRSLTLIILLLAMPAASAPARAQVSAAAPAFTPTPVHYGDLVRRARTMLIDSMTASGTPGLSVAVMVKGTVVWSEGLGFADLEQHVPATPLTRFRIGSVSKSLSSALLGLMVEEGKLDLDAPVQRYVPSFPKKPWPITTRLAAGHLAGIRHYNGDEFMNQKHFANVTEGLAIFENDSLLSKPGTAFSYSSYGFNLVSAAIEGAGKEPFLAAMERRVFEPLGMIHTAPDYPDSLVDQRAHFYDRLKSGITLNEPFVDNSYKWAGGGFLSTTEDLVRFADALLRGKLLKPATVQLLMSSQRTTAGTETKYGMGWFVDRDSTGRRVVYHSGGAAGGTALLVLFPDQEVIVAVLANSESPVPGLARKIAEMFL